MLFPTTLVGSYPQPEWLIDRETLAGKEIMVGCLDLSDMTVETPQTVAERIRRALPYVRKEDVILAPDCGMKYLPRDVAYGKMRAMVEAAKILRGEHGA